MRIASGFRTLQTVAKINQVREFANFFYNTAIKIHRLVPGECLALDKQLYSSLLVAEALKELNIMESSIFSTHKGR